MDVLLSWPGIAAIVLATVATTLAAVRLVRWIRRRRGPVRYEEGDWVDDAWPASLVHLFNRLSRDLVDRFQFETERRAHEAREAREREVKRLYDDLGEHLRALRQDLSWEWAARARGGDELDDEPLVAQLIQEYKQRYRELIDALERANHELDAREAERRALREDMAEQIRALRDDLAREREEQAFVERAARRAEEGEWLEALDGKLAQWAARARDRDEEPSDPDSIRLSDQVRDALEKSERHLRLAEVREAVRRGLREDLAADLRAFRENLAREWQAQASAERAARQAEQAEWLEALDRKLAALAAPPAEEEGSEGTEFPVVRLAPPREPEADEYRVWFATNRRLAYPNDPTRGYSSARDRIVRHGYCDVYVPESHRIGSVGSSALRRLLSGTDDRLRLRAIAKMEADAYWAAVARQLAEAEPGERHAVVFIHGYNVSFEEAAIRAAQIGFDLGIGTMAFFSWPSKGSGSRRAYQSDGQSIGASEGAIADYLVDFAQRSGAEAVHVIVHSMGNQGVLRAMNRIVADAQRRGACRFGQLILAAADVDADTFGELAGAYRELAARTTLYVSGRDLALKASAWFADYPRVGLYPPVSVFDGIDTVSVSNIDLTLLGHGYVGGARDVLQDMHRLIFTGEAPPRFGLRPRQNAEGKTYWEVGA